MAWEGVHTALITPFADGRLDLDAWEALLARQLRGRVHGLVVNGTTGESPTLESDEVALLLRETVAMARGKAVITLGVGTNSTRSTVANVERAREGGADAGLLVLPYYNKPNLSGLRAHVRAAAQPGLPLVVYHVPGRTGQRLNPTELAVLCEIEGVVAVKEATGDVGYGQEFMLRSRCPVLSGDDFTWMPLLSVGASGVISVLSNVAPRRTVAVWEAWKRGDAAEAAREHASLFPVVRYLFAESNPIPVKAMMSEMGLCRNELRLPLAPGTLPDEALLPDLA
jgi:4-hydroxy-tetrahydrodipicolinate synthase